MHYGSADTHSHAQRLPYRASRAGLWQNSKGAEAQAVIKTRNGHVLITESDVRVKHLRQNSASLFQMVFQMVF